MIQAYPLQLHCDVCGRFIPFTDFDSGVATRELVTPDSDRSSEEYETLCKLHAKGRSRP